MKKAEFKVPAADSELEVLKSARRILRRLSRQLQKLEDAAESGSEADVEKFSRFEDWILSKKQLDIFGSEVALSA